LASPDKRCLQSSEGLWTVSGSEKPGFLKKTNTLLFAVLLGIGLYGFLDFLFERAVGKLVG